MTHDIENVIYAVSDGEASAYKVDDHHFFVIWYGHLLMVDFSSLSFHGKPSIGLEWIEKGQGLEKPIPENEWKHLYSMICSHASDRKNSKGKIVEMILEKIFENDEI